MAAVPLSKSELEFTVQALRVENVRVDGRALAAYRRLGIRFGAAHGEVEVNFGPTRALAVCSGEIIVPPANRPNEGKISFHVEFGPLASPSFEVGRPSAQATSVANFVERLLRGSRAIDSEALCIVGGQKVWSIRVDVRALDDDGNLNDVCAIAALCSLLHFRKADVEVHGEAAKTFSTEERAPVPLSIHHLPVPVTFALFAGGSGKEGEPAWILDPNRLEEAAMGGALCIAVNQHGELCGVHKPGGMPIDFAMVQHCTELAIARAKEITTRIQGEIEADLAKRQQAKKNVHQMFNKASLLTVDWAASDAKEASLPMAPAPLPQRPALPAVIPAPQPTAPEPAMQPEAASTGEAAKGARWRNRARSRAAAEPQAGPDAMADVTAGPVEDDGRDIDAELQAVAAEAAELEAQLAAAAESEMAATAEAEATGASSWSGGVEWATLSASAGASSSADAGVGTPRSAGGTEEDLGAAVVKRKKKKIKVTRASA